MKKRMLPLGFLVAALTAITWAAPAAGEVDAKAAFEKMKTLAGNWNGMGDKGVATAVTYRLGANGNSVIETQCGGTSQEMVTVYSIAGSDLVATHYCNLGNQPHWKLDRGKSTADQLVFAFDGGTGLDPAKDGHIHGGTINFNPGGKVETTWEFYEGGQRQNATTFHLNRLPQGAALRTRCGRPAPPRK